MSGVSSKSNTDARSVESSSRSNLLVAAEAEKRDVLRIVTSDRNLHLREFSFGTKATFPRWHDQCYTVKAEIDEVQVGDTD